MNLISCLYCGTVYDADILCFPKLIELVDGTIDTNKAVWDGDGFRPKVDCRACGETIVKP